MSPSLRDRALRGARGVVRRAVPPTLSVVVDARGREADVRATIDSARQADDRRLEIVVTLAEDHLRPLAEEAAGGDWRVRVVEALAADPAAARRAGAEAARGASLWFLPPRHVLPAWVRVESSTDLVAGEAVLAGRSDLSGTLGRFQVPRLTWMGTEDDGEPAGQVAALRLLRDHDVRRSALEAVEDLGPVRPRPFEPQVDPLPGLAARIAFDERMLALAEDRVGTSVGLLARDLPPFLDAVERCTDEQWRTLQQHVAELVRLAGASLADVPVEDRVLAWLTAEGRFDDLVAYVASRRFSRGQFPTDVRGGLIRAELGVTDVPDHVLALTEAESPLRVRVVHLSDDEAVLWVAIARLDEVDPVVTVTIDGRAVEVEQLSDAAVTRWMGETFQCHDHGVATLRVRPEDELAEVVEVTVTDRGVRRLAEANFLEVDGPAGGKPAHLTDDEAGPYRQHLLQQEYAAVTEPVDPRLVYFQTYLGQAATDHPGAIQAALERVRPDGVRVLWCVADPSVPVPEGAEPVLLRSRAWYDVMARAAWIVTNVELEPWFVRREGQEVLETYHGYPSKAMGLSQWRQRDLVPTHVQELLRRTSGTWNNLLTPIPAMDRHYRENYAFEGRIISQGYPRDDSLVAAGHEQRREDARRQLGIAPHQQAVLYAPTWRDDLATDHRRAQAVLHLDVEQAARDLGPDHVLLMRGHRFHAPSAGGAQVVDVTTYPEVNDLILAADAVVLDYSSMRFDVALTGTPMVFLVPDLADYAGRTRGFLYPFEDSAPGPFVESTAEVVELLRDVPALRAAWAERIAAFNAEYQPLSDGHAAERVVAELFAPLLEDGR